MVLQHIRANGIEEKAPYTYCYTEMHGRTSTREHTIVWSLGVLQCVFWHWEKTERTQHQETYNNRWYQIECAVTFNLPNCIKERIQCVHVVVFVCRE